MVPALDRSDFDQGGTEGWIDPIRRLAEQADRVHALMNNRYGDYGVRNARQLAELLAFS
jgi:uncharacterized protein YecE (DUF72 family)